MAYLRKALSPDDTTITFHLEEGEEMPEPGHTIGIEGEDIKIGKQLFSKYGVATYEILE
jgi:hypothetical protein